MHRACKFLVGKSLSLSDEHRLFYNLHTTNRDLIWGSMVKSGYKSKKKKGKRRVREVTDFFPVTEFFAGSELVTEVLKDKGASFSVETTGKIES